MWSTEFVPLLHLVVFKLAILLPAEPWEMQQIARAEFHSSQVAEAQEGQSLQKLRIFEATDFPQLWVALHAKEMQRFCEQKLDLSELWAKEKHK